MLLQYYELLHFWLFSVMWSMCVWGLCCMDWLVGVSPMLTRALVTSLHNG